MKKTAVSGLERKLFFSFLAVSPNQTKELQNQALFKVRLPTRRPGRGAPSKCSALGHIIYQRVAGVHIYCSLFDGGGQKQGFSTGVEMDLFVFRNILFTEETPFTGNPCTCLLSVLSFCVNEEAAQAHVPCRERKGLH